MECHAIGRDDTHHSAIVRDDTTLPSENDEFFFKGSHSEIFIYDLGLYSFRELDFFQERNIVVWFYRPSCIFEINS